MMQRAVTLDRPRADYQDDTVAWVETQVALLRAGRLAEIDLPNIIEEIEGVAKSQRLALTSQIGRVIEHLLKLIYSPAKDPRRGWTESMSDARRQIERILDDSPSLRGEVDAIVEREIGREARDVARSLTNYGELDPASRAGFRTHYFTPDQVLGDWLPPER